MASRAELEAAHDAKAAEFKGKDVPRPPHWIGYRLAPLSIEFWLDRPYRLHDRLVYRRSSVEDAWTSERLYP